VLRVLPGGHARGTVIASGGRVVIAAGGADITAKIGSGAVVTVLSGGTVSAPIISGGTLNLDTGYHVAGNIDFATATSGTLVVFGSVLPGSAHVISGFDVGDVVDLRGVPFSVSGTATLKAGNRLHIVEGGKGFNLFFDPKQGFAGETFTLSKDGHGGTAVRLIPPAGGAEIAWFGSSHLPASAAGPLGTSTLYTSAEHSFPLGTGAASAGI
jgi:autotransporter passenger strand-loop-strand repeat protein